MKKFFDEVKRIVTDKNGNFGLSSDLRIRYGWHGMRCLVASVYARALASVTYDEHGIELRVAGLEDDALYLYDRYMDSELPKKRGAIVAKVKSLCEKAVKGSERNQ